MKKSLLLALISTLLFSSTRAYGNIQQQMLDDLNTYRAQLNRQILTGDDILMQVAQDYACVLAGRGLESFKVYNHIDIDGSEPLERAERAGYVTPYTYGENLAALSNKSATSEDVLLNWKQSPVHNLNMIMKDYTYAGFGSCVGSDGSYRAQVFSDADYPNGNKIIYTPSIGGDAFPGATCGIDSNNKPIIVLDNGQCPNEISVLTEIDKAVAWMYENGLTSKSTVITFLPNDTMTREEASKFFGVFAKNQFNKTETITAGCDFNDIKKADSTLTGNITSACKLGIFKGYKGIFSPKDKLTNVQAITVLMRIMVGTLQEPSTAFYTNYLSKAKEFGLIENINVNNNITRGEAAILLYKANTYKENLNN